NHASAEGEESPRYLGLAEEGSLSRDNDVAVQGDFEAPCQARTVDGNHKRLAEPATGEAEGVVGVAPVRHPVRYGFLEQRKVVAGAEYRSMPEEQSAPQVVVLVESAIGFGQPAYDLGRQGVAFPRPIDSDQHDPITDLGSHAALVGRIHDFR